MPFSALIPIRPSKKGILLAVRAVETDGGAAKVLTSGYRMIQKERNIDLESSTHQEVNPRLNQMKD
jgi:hypothetical protein